jgi:hypothetical protein
MHGKDGGSAGRQFQFHCGSLSACGFERAGLRPAASRRDSKPGGLRRGPMVGGALNGRIRKQTLFAGVRRDRAISKFQHLAPADGALRAGAV